jgi:hypothetical protein
MGFFLRTRQKNSSLLYTFLTIPFDEDKLHFLLISLLIHDQQFYMAPSFAETIFRKDKKIVKLSVRTEISTRYQPKIEDFRKYNNYLLKEYNI